MRMAGMDRAAMAAALREEKARAVEAEDFARAAVVAKALGEIEGTGGAKAAGGGKAAYSSLPPPAQQPRPPPKKEVGPTKDEVVQRRAAESMFDSMMDDF